MLSPSMNRLLTVTAVVAMVIVFIWQAAIAIRLRPTPGIFVEYRDVLFGYGSDGGGDGGADGGDDGGDNGGNGGNGGSSGASSSRCNTPGLACPAIALACGCSGDFVGLDPCNGCEPEPCPGGESAGSMCEDDDDNSSSAVFSSSSRACPPANCRADQCIELGGGSDGCDVCVDCGASASSANSSASRNSSRSASSQSNSSRSQIGRCPPGGCHCVLDPSVQFSPHDFCEDQGGTYTMATSSTPLGTCTFCTECAVNNQGACTKTCETHICGGLVDKSGGVVTACDKNECTASSFSSLSVSSSSSFSTGNSSVSSKSTSSFGNRNCPQPPPSCGNKIAWCCPDNAWTCANPPPPNTEVSVSFFDAFCGINPVSSSSSSRSSSVSSLSFQSQSSSSPVGGECDGTECIQGGAAFCQAQNATCTTLPAFPCISCVANNTSSFSVGSPRSSSSFAFSTFSITSQSSTSVIAGGSCFGTECELGGSAFCESQGKTCFQTANFPCIQCVDPSAASSSSRFSAFLFSQSSISQASFGSLRSTSSQIALTNLCSGAECSEGGDSYCSAFGNTCIRTTDDLCFACITQDVVEQFAQLPTPPDILPPGTPSQSPPGNFYQRIALGQYPEQVAAAVINETSIPGCLCTGDQRCVNNTCLEREAILRLPAFCGNARIDSGETCDDGSLNSLRPNAICRPDCSPGRCGDGILDAPTELCDDGNTANNDGCSSLCQIERAAPTTTETLPAQIIELPLQPSTTTSPTIIAGVPQNQQPLINQPLSTPPSTTDSGPAALALMAAGAAAGYSYMRRKRG